LHYPLASHAWARVAAEQVSCVHDPHTFWKLEDFLFDHQSEINPRNIVVKITDYLSELPSSETDLPQFERCVEAKGSVAPIDEDVALGKSLNVSATPTVFIDGRRLVGIKRAEEVQRWIK
jgi:protein-disulfide isomerase